MSERYATGAVVPERDRCICRDVCVDHCRACNHSGRDLEESCIADPDWEPDDDYLAIREAAMRAPNTPACCVASGVGVCDAHGSNR